MKTEPATFVNRSNATDAQIARTVTPQRRAFLEEAFMSHLGPEVGGNVPHIIDSYARVAISTSTECSMTHQRRSHPFTGTSVSTAME